jgi:hypothetical protein
MSNLSKVPALVLLALAAAPFAACGGSGSTGPTSSACSPFCQASLSCIDPSICTLSDPTGDQAACVSACEAGFAALSADEAALVTTCLDCVTPAVAAACPNSPSADTCSAECTSASMAAAGLKWQTANQIAAASAVGQCTDGHSLKQFGEYFGYGFCGGGGNPMACSLACCFGTSCATPQVGLSCTGGTNCTCTAGKNAGMAVQAAGCAADVWTLCNQ